MKADISSLLCYKLFSLVKLNEQFIDQQMMPFDLSRTQWKLMARFNFLPLRWTSPSSSMSFNRSFKGMRSSPDRPKWRTISRLLVRVGLSARNVKICSRVGGLPDFLPETFRVFFPGLERLLVGLDLVN